MMIPSRERVPVRTIATTIGMVLATTLVLLVAWRLARVLTWILVAGFFAVVIGPAVDRIERHLRLRRSIAAGLVFLVGFILVAGLVTIFVRPIAQQATQLTTKIPDYVDQARTGRGPIGGLIKHYHLDEYARRYQDQLRGALNQLGSRTFTVVRGVFGTVVAFVTILVLTYFMVLQAPQLTAGWIALLPPGARERTRRVAAGCAKALTGYVTGNLLISLIAGVATYLVLLILGVPFPEVLALWVAFTDLIPLVGATLGAIVVLAVAFLGSVTDGLVVLGFFIAYQQVENHLLQAVVMSRTVKVSPLAVLVSVLIGVELFGLLGALLAIPAAGVVYVVWRDLYDHYQGRRGPEPTVGEDEVPVSEQPDGEPDG